MSKFYADRKLRPLPQREHAKPPILPRLVKRDAKKDKDQK